MFTTKLTEHDPHNPKRQLTIVDFMGALARLSVLRQKSAVKPDIQLPTSLSKIIEENILPLTPGFDTFDHDRAPPNLFASAAVRQKLTIHETRLKKLFRKWATADEARQTISMAEWLDMFRASETTGKDLDEDKLMQAFVVAELGDHKSSYSDWQAAGGVESACADLIFPEFVEAILRAALLKYDYDPRTSVDLKIHELCLLLIFGPAGLQPPVRPTNLGRPPLAGVERRPAAAGVVQAP